MSDSYKTNETDRLLKEILEAERHEIHDLHQIHSVLEEILKVLSKTTGQVSSFRVSSSGGIVNINPGQTTVLTAVPLVASGNPTTLPSGDVPNWSASDTSQITATPDPTGLILTVVVNANATAETITFTITDSVIPAATGTFSLTITPSVTPPNPVASFSVTASTPAVKK